jgi:hypothetical protein
MQPRPPTGPLPTPLPPPPPRASISSERREPSPASEAITKRLITPFAAIAAPPAPLGDPPPSSPAPGGPPPALVERVAALLTRRVRGGPPVWSLLAGIAPVALGLAVLLLRPQTGHLRIAVASQHGGADKVEVFVDGQKRCDVVPCLVRDLTPGPKFVRVLAAGFSAGPTTTIDVEPGVERFAVVSLGERRRAGDTGGAADDGGSRGSLAVRTGR